MQMRYTAEQMAKLIVLAETLLHARSTTSVQNAPAFSLNFRNYKDAEHFETAFDDAVISVRNVKPRLPDFLNARNQS